jgi:long-subunit fatty acid transport protein
VSRVLRTALASALFLAGARAHASPQDLFGFGARPVSMGGTGAAYADDYSAVHANPAGLSRLRARSLTLGYVGTAFWLELADRHFAADTGSATMIGVGLPIPFGGVLRDRVAIGLGFFTPTNVIVRGRIIRATTPQFIILPDRVQSVALQLGIGVALPAGFRIGGGVMAMAGLTGTVLVAADASGRASSRIDDQLVATYAPVVGAQWERGDWRFGATYRGALVANFLVSIEARDLGINLPVFNISGVAQYDPSQVQVEAAWQRRGWTAAAGFTSKLWSAYPGPASATTDNSPAPPAPGFSDTFVARLGVEHRWRWDDGTHVALRGGYAYEPTPAPPGTPERAYLDNDRHAFTAGLSLGATAAGTRYTVDVFSQTQWLPPREATTPTGAASHGGALLHIGASASVTF